MDWADAQVSRIGEMESQTFEMGGMVCARHLIPAGFDSAPLYRGLPDDMCPCEHWCYLAKGQLRYRFSDGDTLTARAGDAFHLRAGPDHRTPEHIHPEMEERWEVLAGSVGFRIDGVEQIAGPGDVIVAPPGSPHTAWNSGEETVRLRIQMRPALRWQEFVERLFALRMMATSMKEASQIPTQLAL